MENRGWVADAFFERLGRHLGRQKPKKCHFWGALLATIFDQKSKKWPPKRHPKIDAEKVSKNDAKMMPK